MPANAPPRNPLEGLYKPGYVWLHRYPLHTHEFEEIFWIDDGVALHEVNGEEQVLEKGDLFFMRRGDVHAFSTKSDDKPFLLRNIAFPSETLASLCDRFYGGSAAVYGEGEALPRRFSLTARQLSLFRQAFFTLFQARRTPLQIERFLLTIFGELCPCDEAYTPTDSARHLPPWLDQARQAMRDPDRLRLGVPEFYRLCGRCPEHASRESRRLFGETPGEYVHRLRMEYAASLLGGTSMEIVDIAMECGFESLSHFYACFRKIYAMTPYRYRKQAQTDMY